MIESISVDHLEERKTVIQNDIGVVNQRLQDYEKTKAQLEQKRLEDVGLINALTGALQQIELFLKEIHNETPEGESDVENSES
jgi:septal ring factor EnvC (AmiA/AmiB activator)